MHISRIVQPASPSSEVRQPVRALALVTLLVAALPVAAAEPQELVRKSIDRVIEVLKDESKSDADKRREVESLVKGHFDFIAMSRRILGQSWKQASPDQQAQFASLLEQILSNTYWNRLRSFTNERVDYLKEEIKQDKYAKVDTLIITRTVEIPVDYKLYRKGDEWLVYDVVIEQVSLVRNYRGSYSEIIKNDGIDGLLAKMQAKIEAPPKDA
jgi:phospholipid transport system substrate-binding protein